MKAKTETIKVTITTQNMEDILNALIADPLADAMRRAFELNAPRIEIVHALKRGVRAGAHEISERICGAGADESLIEERADAFLREVEGR